jgi:hypothetical protein
LVYFFIRRRRRRRRRRRNVAKEGFRLERVIGGQKNKTSISVWQKQQGGS